MVSELWMSTACEIVDALEQGEISPIDVLESIEKRHSFINPLINALPTTCFDRAKNQINCDIDNSLRGRKPLFGLPIPIKDSYPVSGVRTSYGSLVFKNYIPTFSDLAVLTLEQSGAIIYAKSNTPEFEAGASTFNEIAHAVS